MCDIDLGEHAPPPLRSFWTFVGTRLENRTGYVLSLVPNIVSDGVMAFAAAGGGGGGGGGSLALAITCAGFQGFGWSGQARAGGCGRCLVTRGATQGVFGSSIYSDCVDYDQLHSGRRREVGRTWTGHVCVGGPVPTRGGAGTV